MRNLHIVLLNESKETINELKYPLNQYEYEFMKNNLGENVLEKGLIEVYNYDEYIQLTTDISHILMTIQKESQSDYKLAISMEG